MQGKKISVKSDFGRLLKSLRIRSDTHWTQESLAKALRDAGCKASIRTYKGYENGESIPSVEVLKHLVVLLGLNKEDQDALYGAAAQIPLGIHNFPFLRNPFFTGRERYLEQLRTQLQELGTVGITQPISVAGLGGIGKTQLALEYAYSCYPNVYNVVLWVNAADQASLQTSYGDIAQRLNLPERDKRDSERLVRAVKHWLESHENWLLIMDNADDLLLARSFFPEINHGHILLPTRSQFAGSIGASKIDIDKMEPEEGLLFLLRRSGVSGDETNAREAASRLVELLDGHPLALDQAGAYIEETGTSFTAYMNLYHKQRSDLLGKRRALDDDNPAYNQHPESVVTTFKLCLGSLLETHERHPLAIYILYFCAFLHPDDMPEELFLQDGAIGLDISDFNTGIAALQRYSLIKRNRQGTTLSMHRLVQEVFIDDTAPETRKLFRENVVHALSTAFPSAGLMAWGYYRRLSPHALICATWTDDELTPTLEAVELFRTASLHLREEGRYAEAETLLSRAFSILLQHLGAEHPRTASVLNELANLYTAQGKDDQAESLYLQTVAIQNMPPEARHPATARCLRHLSVLYLNHGKFDQSKSLLEQALSIQEEHLGAEHPQTAKSLCMLAVLYYAQGEYTQAELLYWRTIRTWDKHDFAERDVQVPLDGSTLLKYEQVQHERVIPLFNRAFSVDVQTIEAMPGFGEAIAKKYFDVPHTRGLDAEAPASNADHEPSE